MKQFSIVLNFVLVIAVAFLYYLHFTGAKKAPVYTANVNHTYRDSGFHKRMVVAYVELDSLNNNVDFIRQQKKELEAEQKLITNEYTTSYHELTALRDNFLKKGKSI